jgi:hypothetical protein
MNFSELKPDAIYRLTEDVKNPKADRRYKNQPNMAPVWRKGTRFLAREEVYEDVVAGVDIRIVWYKLEFVDRQNGSYYGIKIQEDGKSKSDTRQAEVIMAALEPTEEDFSALVKRLQLDDYAVKNLLKQMCADGTVTHKQIEDVANRWMNEPDED